MDEIFNKKKQDEKIKEISKLLEIYMDKKKSHEIKDQILNTDLESI